MEQLAIRSFLKHNYSFHLYAYQEIDNVPPGTVLLDANQILPESSIFKYTEHDSYAGFSNFFRYKLLLERGGWWVDMDMVCLAPFDFDAEYVFSSEVHEGSIQVNCGVIKAPEGAPLLEYLWESCRRRDPTRIRWGDTGPSLMNSAVRQFSLTEFALAPKVFCPIDHPEWESILNRSANHKFDEQTRAVHLWNEMWRRAGRDKNATYAWGSFYERLMRKHGLENEPPNLAAAAIRKLRATFSRD